MRHRLDQLSPEDRAHALFSRLVVKSPYFTRRGQQLAVEAIYQWLHGYKRLKKHERVIRQFTVENWLSLTESIAEQSPQDTNKALIWLLIWLKDAE